MPSHPTIRPGDKRKEVLRAKWLEKRHLKKMGRSTLAGKIGMHTRYGGVAVQGIKLIQKKYKLAVDGIIGPNTWRVLELAAPKTPAPVFSPISRKTWGAKAPKSRVKCDWNSRTTSFIHHTVTKAPTGSGTALKEAERAHMRYLQQIAFNRGFHDISYSYIIFPSGRVYVGRGFEVVGAHTLGHNTEIGIAFVGNFENDQPTKAALSSLEKLRKHVKASYGKKVAHCKVYSTACCGKNLRAKLGLSC